MAFRFKQFLVEDDRSSMRVGTDAVLLGSWIIPGNASRILDIGTGCGVIALMMAQKSQADITAIDFDRDSAVQASLNFKTSLWHKRLRLLHISFRDFIKDNNDQFDLIVANPPWFSNSLKPQRTGRIIARHNDHLKLDDLFDGVKNILKENGIFSLIIPAEDAISAMEIAKGNDLFLSRQLLVIPKPGRKPKRILMEFSFSCPDNVTMQEIIIRWDNDSFTPGYRELTKDFYIGF